MQNRIQRLRVEEERAQKNIEDIRNRAEEIVSDLFICLLALRNQAAHIRPSWPRLT